MSTTNAMEAARNGIPLSRQIDDADFRQYENRDRREGSGDEASPPGGGGHALREHAEDERREQRGIEEAEQRLRVVHQVGVAGGDERRTPQAPWRPTSLSARSGCNRGRSGP